MPAEVLGRTTSFQTGILHLFRTSTYAVKTFVNEYICEKETAV